jgi:hypothetical protein
MKVGEQPHGALLRAAVALGRLAAEMGIADRFSPTSISDRLQRHRVVLEPAPAGQGSTHGTGFRTPH